MKKCGAHIPAPTNCQYASECVLPVKKVADGNYTDRRFCVDYREINFATKADKYGLHRPEQIFGDIRGHGFFTKMGLRAGVTRLLISKGLSITKFVKQVYRRTVPRLWMTYLFIERLLMST